MAVMRPNWPLRSAVLGSANCGVLKTGVCKAHLQCDVFVERGVLDERKVQIKVARAARMGQGARRIAERERGALQDTAWCGIERVIASPVSLVRRHGSMARA